MSTFLELCQDVARESGTVSGVQPASVESQDGRLFNIVQWTAKAWKQIQNSRSEWKWMRKEFTGNCVVGSGKYAGASFGIADFSRWITSDEGITIYDPAVGAADEGEVTKIDWPSYRARYRRGSQVNNRPRDFTVSPAQELCLGPLPDKSYVVSGEYYKKPQILTANGDVPDLPEHFHDLIVYQALILLAEHDEGSVTMAIAMKNYRDMLADLEREQLPTITLGGGPLA